MRPPELMGATSPSIMLQVSMDEFLRAMADLTNHLPDDKFDAGIHKVRALLPAEMNRRAHPWKKKST
jgi:hypothetical protein